MDKNIKFIMKNSKDDYNRNVILNYCFKISGIFLGLVSTRLILVYLGVTLYGLWITITSVISWMSSGDLGIGNGLRNELAKAYAVGDKGSQKKLIASAYLAMSKVSIVLLILIIILSEIFFKINILTNEVRAAMYITSFFFCLNLFLGVSQSVALGYQKSWLTTLTICEIQICTIVAVRLLKIVDITANLNLFALINGLCTLIPNVILIILLKINGIDILKCLSVKKDRRISNSLIGIGIQFFGIQICAIILYSTDSLLINKLISSEMVTKYSIITKVYDTGASIFSILLIPLWSAVTYNIAKNNIWWIKNKVRQLLVYWLIFSTGVLIVSLLFNQIVKIWLGNNAIQYEWSLISLFGIYCSMTAFSAIFVNVLNGMGVVKLQLFLSVVAAIANIPLSVFLSTSCKLGIFGIKLATFISALINAIIIPIQAMLEIRKREEDRGALVKRHHIRMHHKNCHSCK